jgi:SNF2 family DNA or RNA helicase
MAGTRGAQLRQVCNDLKRICQHPFMLPEFEPEHPEIPAVPHPAGSPAAAEAAAAEAEYLSALLASSAKLQLLDSMLGQLREQGQQVMVMAHSPRVSSGFSIHSIGFPASGMQKQTYRKETAKPVASCSCILSLPLCCLPQRLQSLHAVWALLFCWRLLPLLAKPLKPLTDPCVVPCCAVPCCAVLQMLELIADYARIKYGPGSYELTDPATPAAARYAAVQRFNAAAEAAAGAAAAGAPKQPFLYLITPRSIGLGTQLPGLSAAIIFESDWHPRLDVQALHR